MPDEGDFRPFEPHERDSRLARFVMGNHQGNLKVGILAMQDFLDRVIPPVEKSVLAYGKRTSCETHSAWTDTEYELTDFEKEHNFRFEMSSSGMAHCSTSVFYHGIEVLRVEYESAFTVSGCKVKVFNRIHDLWALELIKFINNFERIFSSLATKKAIELNERSRLSELEAENLALSTEAKRLKVS